MSRSHAALLVAAALGISTAWVHAQATPKLSPYYTRIFPEKVLAPGVDFGFQVLTGNHDLDGDGNQDLVVLGAESPSGGATTYAPRPGRVYLGDGNGNFTAAPPTLFPVDTLQTVTCVPSFADFNGDGRPDMFLTCGGWDVFRGPGEQNRLYLSRPEGGWRDATDTLPQLSDRSHSVAIGDISGRGALDIFVGNGYEGQNQIPCYTLLNTGSGLFTQTGSNIPAGSNQLLDAYSAHLSSAALLTDLNGDGLPELVVGANGTDVGGTTSPKIHRTTILWNRSGVFVEADKTELPMPAGFSNRTDQEIQAIDVNRDGLPDLVVVGRQGLPFRGWFVQILVNHGNREFVDETAARVPPGGAWGGTDGVDTAVPSAFHVQVLDFNGDGVPDFSVEFQPNAEGFAQTHPLVWLNDGTGHFSTLKVGDFVSAGNEYLLGTAHLTATRNGYSFITPRYNPKLGIPLTIVGLLATKPYRTAAASASRN